MTNIETIERLVKIGGGLTVSELRKFNQGNYLIEEIKKGGIEISETDLVGDVAEKLSQDLGIGMKLLFKLDEALVAELIKAIEGEQAAEAEETKEAKTTETKEIKEEIKAEEGDKKMTNKNVSGGKEMENVTVTINLLEEMANLLAEERVTVIELLEDYPKSKTILDAFKASKIRIVKKSQLVTLIGKAEEAGVMNKILTAINYDDFMEALEAIRGDYAELETEESDNNNKGGSEMETTGTTVEVKAAPVKEEKQEVKEEKGGNMAKQEEVKEAKTVTEVTTETKEEVKPANAATAERKGEGLFGVNHRINFLNTEGYLVAFTTIATEFGKEGLDAIDKIGTKVAVVSYKEKSTLKDLLYRGLILATVEWIKDKFDNEFIEFIGSSIQGYQIIRVGMDIYRLYKSFNSVTRKDVEDLNALLERLYAERRKERKESVNRVPAIDD